MNNDSETVVVSAAGAGRRVFVVPVVALALAVAAANLALVHLVEPRAVRRSAPRSRTRGPT